MTDSLASLDLITADCPGAALQEPFRRARREPGPARVRMHGVPAFLLVRFADVRAFLAELSSPDPVATRRTIGALHGTPWLVYVKRPFGGAKRLFHYLGRYTHRVGLSNQRLVSVTPDAVTFRTKDGRTVALAPAEFLTLA